MDLIIPSEFNNEAELSNFSVGRCVVSVNVKAFILNKCESEGQQLSAIHLIT